MIDNTDRFFRDTFMKLLEEKIDNVKTQEEADTIIKKFEKLDLSKIFIEMFTEMASDTTKYMRNTMHEQVMQFRAEEQEFLAIQEQKWCNAFVASESMYIMVLEATKSYVESVNELS